jgi:hypothetical protein
MASDGSIPMTYVDEILAEVTKTLRPVLEAAFAHVKDDAKREAAAEFKAKVSAMLDEAPQPTIAAITPKDDQIAFSPPSPRKTRKGRAAPGTVKPQILDVVRQSPEGISTRDIATLTAFKYNSVRGTLWLLKKEELVINRDEKWFPMPKKAAVSPVREGVFQ